MAIRASSQTTHKTRRGHHWRSGESSKKQQQQPQPPFPAQHQEKPGLETELQPRPKYQAPLYQGSGKLRNRVALITGGDSGIGRAVAVLYAREGADVALVFLSEELRDAEETRDAVEAEGRHALLIPGDVTNPHFCREAVQRTVTHFGKLDILEEKRAALADRRAVLRQSQKEAEDTQRTHRQTTEQVTRLDQEMADLGARDTERGYVLTLSDIQFHTDEAKLTADAMRKLYPLVTLLR